MCSVIVSNILKQIHNKKPQVAYYDSLSKGENIDSMMIETIIDMLKQEQL